MNLLSFILFSFALAYNELLPPHGKICYHDTFTYGDRLALSFQVGTRDPSSSEQLDVDFWVIGPQGNRVLYLDRVTDGKPDLRVSMNGKYSFCFSNEYSGIKSKDITFYMNELVVTELSRDINTDNLDGQIKLVNRLIEDIQHEQAYILIRERVHRNTAESTNSRVKFWSIFQLLVVIANSLFQIFYLKRFFEVRSNV